MKDLGGKAIALASDHAGFDKKQVTIRYLQEKGISYKDFGCFSDGSCDYPDFAHKIGKAIDNGEYETGITFCGSGQGISITANKYQNVRSALCWNVEIAVLSKQHNDANICAIPGRFVNEKETINIVEAYLSAEFEGGRHARRIKKIPVK
ncbi:RpiB/LacA/LacB family sugar-phosphate isomerase [Maribellus maritimus]|uniref:RpiB/LacA/LacB family sugar-phosphate isomerase n=1 Tax=Maribellus maritimus TaxID=2870838 RepID=UPI001EEBB630|nr:RpiB/LacA/LacB family sugar-phosphate isomerase [Maribellus maritimus]MCG6190739.1 RpiB/LacA/LacB family sugar-phosphate isomerase [Maribellus maritimus]